MRAVIRIFLPVIDVFLSPFVAAGALLFFLIRKAGIRNMRLSRSIFMKVGVFPIIDHYYDPFFSKRQIRTPFGLTDPFRALT